MWNKITSADGIYYETKVEFGNLNIWLTATNDGWFIEADSTLIANGVANGYEDAKSLAFINFKDLWKKISDKILADGVVSK